MEFGTVGTVFRSSFCPDAPGRHGAASAEMHAKSLFEVKELAELASASSARRGVVLHSRRPTREKWRHVETLRRQ